MLAAGSASSTIRALLPDGRNLTLPATRTRSSAPLPPGGSTSRLALLFAGDGCLPVPADDAPAGGPFVLFARRGGCTFDVKMHTAVGAGASALVVGDTLAAEYAPPSNATALSAALVNPCIVSCSVGRGEVDARALSLASVLDGLPGACPAPADYTGRRCPTSLCAFSGYAHDGATDGATAPAAVAGAGAASREVCCVLDSPALEMSMPNSTGAHHASVPALYLPLALGQLLERQCTPGTAPGAASGAVLAAPGAAPPALALSGCAVLLLAEETEESGGHWDGYAAHMASGCLCVTDSDCLRLPLNASNCVWPLLVASECFWMCLAASDCF